MATTKSFAVAPQKVTPNQTNFIYPMNCSVSGLKPNSKYDFYVDGKKYNNAVVQGSNKVYDGNGEPTGLNRLSIVIIPVNLELNKGLVIDVVFSTIVELGIISVLVSLLV